MHALCLLDNQGYRGTLRIWNTYWFSKPTIVTQTRLNVKLCDHCLFYLYWFKKIPVPFLTTLHSALQFVMLEIPQCFLLHTELPFSYVRESNKLVCRDGHILGRKITLLNCFVFISEQPTTFATYTINWLVFITEMQSVYSAVRTGSLNKAVCASS